MIPKIIHQSWKSHDLSDYPGGKKLAEASRASWRNLYSDFEYMFWTDADIEAYIKDIPLNYRYEYNKLDMTIKKMDVFRYMILHEYGGIYSDIDFIAHRRIKSQILENSDFIGYMACRNRTPSNYRSHGLDHVVSGKKRRVNGLWVLGNAFFGCEKGSEKIKTAIDTILFDDLKTNIPHISPLVHTGPERIHSIFLQNDFMDTSHIFGKVNIGNDQGLIAAHYRKCSWRSSEDDKSPT